MHFCVFDKNQAVERDRCLFFLCMAGERNQQEEQQCN
jgi:hypothetical protein